MPLFIKLANNENDEKNCLTLECTSFNPNGLGPFRTQAKISDLQTCHFNLADDDHRYNVFISDSINKDVDNNKMYFEIEGIKNQTNNKTFNAEPKLDNLSENGESNGRSTQFGFGINNTRDEKFI